MKYTFTSPCHPVVLNRQGKLADGEHKVYKIWHRTDEGEEGIYGRVEVHMGRKGLLSFLAIIMKYADEDPSLLEEARGLSVTDLWDDIGHTPDYDE